MKISVDDIELFTLSEHQQLVIQDQISSIIFDADMKRRLQYILIHCYEQCFENLKKTWDQKLVLNGIASIPTDPTAYAALVFAQPNYKDRAARDAEQTSPPS